jgi:hypothetical protein
MTEPKTTPVVAPETEYTEDAQGHKHTAVATEDPQSPDGTHQDTEGHMPKKI